jgi:hypothetical protein
MIAGYFNKKGAYTKRLFILVRPAESERSETQSVGRTIPGAKRRGMVMSKYKDIYFN